MTKYAKIGGMAETCTPAYAVRRNVGRLTGLAPANGVESPNRINIEDRPAIVDRKIRVRGWEGGFLIEKSNSQPIIPLVHRRSRLILLCRVGGQTEKEVSAAIIDRLREVRGCVKTLTFDKGLEFSGHAKIAAAIGINIHFARPHHFWERGVSKQPNGLVRQYLPKSSCFGHLTQADVRRVEEKLNHRPRKVLDYKMPHEVMERSYTRRAVALRI